VDIQSDIQSPQRGEHGPLIDSRDGHAAARYLARECQKKELRRERDELVLAIARKGGERALVEQLDVTQENLGKLLAGARERLNGDGSSPTITIRRLSRDPDRWAELDSYYEALGSRPGFTVRRMASPPG